MEDVLFDKWRGGTRQTFKKKKDNTLYKLHIIQKTKFQMNQRAQCENQNSLSISTQCAWISLKPKIMKYFLDSKGNRRLINLIT